MKDTNSSETTLTGNIKDKLTIVRSSYHNIEGKLLSEGYIVGLSNVDGPTNFHRELFKEYKEARQYIREKYGI